MGSQGEHRILGTTSRGQGYRARHTARRHRAASRGLTQEVKDFFAVR